MREERVARLGAGGWGLELESGRLRSGAGFVRPSSTSLLCMRARTRYFESLLRRRSSSFSPSLQPPVPSHFFGDHPA